MPSAPRAIFDFVLFSSQGAKSSTRRGLLVLNKKIGPRWVHVFAVKKNVKFLLFCDFIAPIYKKNNNNNNRNIWDKI